MFYLVLHFVTRWIILMLHSIGCYQSQGSVLASTAGMSSVHTRISVPAEQLCAYHIVSYTGLSRKESKQLEKSSADKCWQFSQFFAGFISCTIEV